MSDISKSIGEELIKESQGPQPKKRGISDELFPYIIVASMNGMSARAISRWLEEKQEIKLSAAMVAKVIRESNKRCLRLFDEMSHRTNLIRNEYTMGSEVTRSPEDSLLFNKQEFESNSPYHMSQTAQILAEECKTKKPMLDAYDSIMEEWFSLPEQFRNEVQRIVIQKAKEAENENADG